MAIATALTFCLRQGKRKNKLICQEYMNIEKIHKVVLLIIVEIKIEYPL
jgi:hypothetical protein